MWQDLVGLTDRVPKFVKRYADARSVIADAVHAWGEDVRTGAFPTQEHEYA